MAFGALFGFFYVLFVAAVVGLVLWALVLLIIFLRLRIAELRRASAAAGAPGSSS